MEIVLPIVIVAWVATLALCTRDKDDPAEREEIRKMMERSNDHPEDDLHFNVSDYDGFGEP